MLMAAALKALRGTSAGPSTATTSGEARALVASIRTTRAWARGLSRSLPWSMPGSTISPEYLAAPVAFSSASTRGRLFPTTLYWLISLPVADLLLRLYGRTSVSAQPRTPWRTGPSAPTKGVRCYCECRGGPPCPPNPAPRGGQGRPPLRRVGAAIANVGADLRVRPAPPPVVDRALRRGGR